MFKFNCIAASTEPDLLNQSFSLEALKEFENKEKLILVGYDGTKPIGKVTSAKVIDNLLYVEGYLYVDAEYYVVPSFRSISGTLTDDGSLEHTQISVCEYGLVDRPVDKKATRAKILGKNK